ncbi:MAG TPA: ester cyclase, partial [Hyphomicrobiaceae bacterium]
MARSCTWVRWSTKSASARRGFDSASTASGPAVRRSGGPPSSPDTSRRIPDLKHTIDEMIACDDKVWARMTARGTHLGPFMGFHPTGKSFTITVLDVCRFER